MHVGAFRERQPEQLQVVVYISTNGGRGGVLVVFRASEPSEDGRLG